MKVLITGGAGFLGRRLAKKLLERGKLTGLDGREQTIDRLVLLDVVPSPPTSDARVSSFAGDIADPALLERLIDTDTASIFHLAAIVSGQAEADFDLGMRVNFDATRTLLEISRARGHRPRVVFASSCAVYGGELPDVVPQLHELMPQSSYGTQKAMGELLIKDYTRRGFIDGRSLRLPTISVRAGKPNAALSSFASGIIREPLNGEAAICPVGEDLRLWLSSPRRAIESLIALHDVDGDVLGPHRIVNLPGISVSVAQMVAALRTVAGDAVADRIRFQRDEAIERIVGSWPGAWELTRAHAMGLAADESFEAIVRAYIEDDLH